MFGLYARARAVCSNTDSWASTYKEVVDVVCREVAPESDVWSRGGLFSTSIPGRVLDWLLPGCKLLVLKPFKHIVVW